MEVAVMNKAFGVTPHGVVIKRLDTILDELHADLSKDWGVNTRLNPKSLLNVQLTAFGDKLAELWEFGEQIYNAMYPYSAEGAALDNAIQFGGITRDEARPAFYPVHAECVEGATIPRGSKIRTNTNPAIDFLAAYDAHVNRNAFNAAKVRVAVVQPGFIYTVALDGSLYSYTSGQADTAAAISAGLAEAIDNDGFGVSVEGSLLVIVSLKANQAHEMVLSGNLTTESVTGIVNYASEADGDIALPNGTITEIVTAVPGLISVVNLLPRVPGRLTETDAEVRRSYADKIFSRSNRMIESIKSAIMGEVPGVRAVAGYQNDKHYQDEYGRWPNCVEMVVDGGNELEVALRIFDKKTDGIQAFGSVEVVVLGDEGEPITIRFNRPEYVYIWYKIAVTHSHTEPLPPNYVEAIQSIVLEEMDKIEPGKPVIPQKMIEHRIYATIPGIGFVQTSTFSAVDPNEQPDEYATGIVQIAPRQRAVTEASRIGVLLDG